MNLDIRGSVGDGESINELGKQSLFGDRKGKKGEDVIRMGMETMGRKKK